MTLENFLLSYVQKKIFTGEEDLVFTDSSKTRQYCLIVSDPLNVLLTKSVKIPFKL